MSPIKSSLARSAKQLLGFFNTADLGLRGAAQSTRRVAPKISASGGNSEFTYNGKRVHKFTSSGSLVIASGGGNIEYVVVAGGGGGGKGANNRGGGGGAGGYRTGTISHPEGPLTVPVTVGDGGISENNGNPSVFNHPASPITSNAGGKGGNEAGNGGDGGSGGGAGGVTSGSTELTRGLATPPGQGNNGSEGWAEAGAEATGGGGGGAGGVGRDINGVDARANGGLGIQLPSTFQDPSNPSGATGPGGGSPGFWVAGGGGAATGTAPGPGYGGSGTEDAGPFAGGGAGVGSGTGNAGTANTGGGGGGGTNDGGAGGSGLVLIAYDA